MFHDGFDAIEEYLLRDQMGFMVDGISNVDAEELIYRSLLDVNAENEVYIGRYYYEFALRAFSEIASYRAGFDYNQALNDFGVADDLTAQPTLSCERLDPEQED